MNRKIARCAALMGATVLATAMMASSAATARTLSLSYFMGPGHSMNAALFTPFAEKLTEVSGGELTVEQFAGGALNSAPPKQYSILVDGVADIAFALPGYTQQLFPVTTSIAVPGLCEEAVGCTDALWNAFPVIQNEFNAKILALWANEPQIWLTKDTPIRALEDVQGMIVRVNSAQDVPFVEALGAAPVSQPVSEINQNLANGVIDAIAIGSSGAMSFKLFEPANYATTNVPGSAAPFVLLMNQGVWDGLSDQEKQWVDEASGKSLSMLGAQGYADEGEAALAAAPGLGIEMINLSDEESARWLEVMQPAVDEWLASEVGQGMTGAEIRDMMQGN